MSLKKQASYYNSLNYNHLMEQIYLHTSEGILVTDPDGTIIAVNPAFTKITGYPSEEVLGKNPRILKSERHDIQFYQTMWDSVLNDGSWKGQIWNRKKNGEIYLEWQIINTIKDEKGNIEFFISIFSDVTKQKMYEDKFETLIYSDALTGLHNRLMLQEKILAFVAEEAWEEEKKAFGLFLINLDRFKNINKSLGFLSGDILLMEVGNRLKNFVGKQGLVARIGSDDFAVLLSCQEPCKENLDSMITFSKEILDLFSTPFLLKREEIMISASIGISIFSIDAADMKSLLQNAETAVQRAKENGGNQVQLYQGEMSQPSLELLIMETNLRKALTQDELLLYYQPQIELKTGKLAGAEALIRWKPTGSEKLVSPAQFIPLAEETGIILPIGQWVIEESARQIKEWMDLGYDLFPIAINLSGKQFSQDGMIDLIKNILEKIQLHPAYLTLEVTESITIKNENEAFQILNQIKAMGMDIAIDDFGTGYSSFSYLKKFPADKLKIDRSFIKDIHENIQDASIVKTIIKLAHHLGFLVVAEGVELEEQVNLLKDFNCDYIQGYYYSPPLPAKEFEEKFLQLPTVDAEPL